MIPAATVAASIAPFVAKSGPWERRCYWLPEGWTAPSAHGPLARAALIDLTRPHHRRQERNYAHEEGVRIRAEEKRARKAARRLALRELAGGAL